jgi:hypothetical protein
MTHKNRKKVKKLHVLIPGCSPLMAGDFSCSFEVLPGSLGINKFKIKMGLIFFYSCKIKNFWSSSHWNLYPN